MKKLNAILLFVLLTTSSLDAVAQRRRSPGRETEASFHNAGVKLHETSSYELYEYRLVNKIFCGDGHTAAVSLVLKVDAKYIITADDVYKRRFETEILPVIKQRCSSLTQVTVFNYVKGVRIGRRDSKIYGYDDQNFDGDEASLANMSISIDQQGRLQYQKRGRWSSLADVRKELEAQAALAAKLEPSLHALPPGARSISSLQNEGLTLYSLSSDPRSWCGSTVEMIITSRDSSGFEKDPEALRYLLKEAWGKSRFHCDGQVRRVNVRMLADGQEVRRGWLEGAIRLDGYVFHEEFSENLSPNPSQEKLNTSGLSYQAILDNLFYGRFDRVQVEDRGNLIFVRIYRSFLEKYGAKYEEFLQPPTTVVVKFEAWNNFGTIASKQTDYKIEKRFESSLRIHLEKGVIGGLMSTQIINDVDVLTSRHKGNSPALLQFRENLLRYAEDLPSIQQKPLTSSITRGHVGPISISKAPNEPLNNAPNPKLVGRWEGKILSSGSQQNTVAIFKKEGESYTGRISNGGREILLKDIRFAGDDVTAKADLATPQATIFISYKFKLLGETIKGQGVSNFNGRIVTFNLDLRRISLNPDVN